MGYGPCEIYRSKTNWVSKTTNIIGATSLQEGLPWFDPSNAIQNGSKEDDDSHKIPLKLRTTLLRCPWSRYVTSNVPYFCQALTSCSIHMTYAFWKIGCPKNLMKSIELLGILRFLDKCMQVFCSQCSW